MSDNTDFSKKITDALAKKIPDNNNYASYFEFESDYKGTGGELPVITWGKPPSMETPRILTVTYANSVILIVDSKQYDSITVDFVVNINAIDKDMMEKTVNANGYCSASIMLILRLMGNYYLFNFNRGRMLVMINDIQKYTGTRDKNTLFAKTIIDINEIRTLFADKSNPDAVSKKAKEKLASVLTSLMEPLENIDKKMTLVKTSNKAKIGEFHKSLNAILEKLRKLKDQIDSIDFVVVETLINDLEKIINEHEKTADKTLQAIREELSSACHKLGQMMEPIAHKNNIKTFSSISDLTNLDHAYYKAMTQIVNEIMDKLVPDHNKITPEEAVNIIKSSSEFIFQEVVTRTKAIADNTDIKIEKDDAFQRKVDLFRRAYTKLAGDVNAVSSGKAALNVATLILSYLLMLNRTLAINAFVYKGVSDNSLTSGLLLLVTQVITGKNIYTVVKWSVLFASSFLSTPNTERALANPTVPGEVGVEPMSKNQKIFMALPLMSMGLFSVVSSLSFVISADDLNSSETGYITSGMFWLSRFAFVNSIVYMAITELVDGFTAAHSIFQLPNQKKTDALQLVEWRLFNTLRKFVTGHMASIPRKFRALDAESTIRTLMALNYSGMDSQELLMFVQSQQMLIGFCIVHLFKHTLYKEIINGYTNKKEDPSYIVQMFHTLLLSGPHDFITRIFTDILGFGKKVAADVLFRIVTGRKRPMTQGTEEILDNVAYAETRKNMVDTLSDSLKNKVKDARIAVLEFVVDKGYVISSEYVSPVVATLLLKYFSVLMLETYGNVGHAPIVSALTVAYIPGSLWTNESTSYPKLSMPLRLATDWIVMEMDMPALAALTIGSRVARHHRVSNMAMSLTIIGAFLAYNSQFDTKAYTYVEDQYHAARNMLMSGNNDFTNTTLDAYAALYGEYDTIDIFNPNYTLTKNNLNQIDQIEAVQPPGTIAKIIKKGRKAAISVLNQIPYVKFGNVIKMTKEREIRMGNYIYNHTKTEELLEAMHNGEDPLDYSEAIVPSIKEAGNAAAVHAMMNVVWTVPPKNPYEYKNYLKANIDIFEKKVMPTKISDLFPNQPWAFFDLVSYNQITPIPIEVVPEEIKLMSISERFARTLSKALFGEAEIDRYYFYDFSEFSDSESVMKTPSTTMVFNHPYEGKNYVMRTNYMLMIQIIETMTEIHQQKVYKDTHVNTLLRAWRSNIKREEFVDFHMKRLAFCMSEVGISRSVLDVKNLGAEERLALVAMMMVNDPETMLRSYFLTFDEFKTAYNGISSADRKKEYCINTIATPSTDRFAGQSVYRYHRYLHATKAEIEDLDEQITELEEKQTQYIINQARKKDLLQLTKGIRSIVASDNDLAVTYEETRRDDLTGLVPFEFQKKVAGKFGSVLDGMLTNHTIVQNSITAEKDHSFAIAKLKKQKTKLFEFVFIDKNIAPDTNIKPTETDQLAITENLILGNAAASTEVAIVPVNVNVPATVKSFGIDEYSYMHVSFKRGENEQKQIVAVPGDTFRVVDIPNSKLSGVYVTTIATKQVKGSTDIMALPLTPGKAGMYMPVFDVKELKDLYMKEYTRLKTAAFDAGTATTDTFGSPVVNMEYVFANTNNDQLQLYSVAHQFLMAIDQYVQRDIDGRLRDLFLHFDTPRASNKMPYYPKKINDVDYYVMYFGSESEDAKIKADWSHSVAYPYIKQTIEQIQYDMSQKKQFQFEEDRAIVPPITPSPDQETTETPDVIEEQKSWTAAIFGGIVAIGAMCATALMIPTPAKPDEIEDTQPIYVKQEPLGREITLATPISDKTSKLVTVGKPQAKAVAIAAVTTKSAYTAFLDKLYTKECEGMLAVRCAYIAANCDEDMIQCIFATRGYSIDTFIDPLLSAVVDHANDANMRFIVSRVFSPDRVKQIVDKQVRDIVTAVFANKDPVAAELDQAWLGNMTDPVSVYARQRRRVFVYDLGEDNLEFTGPINAHDGIVLTADNFTYYRLFLFIMREYTIQTYHMAENRRIHKKIANITVRERRSLQ